MTVINNATPTEGARTGNGMGFLLGIILLIVFLFLLFYYGLPALRGNTGGTQITVPDKMDVNLNQNR